MPLIFAIPYFFIEALSFYAVASWLGVGKALVGLFVVFFIGIIVAAWEMRRISAQLNKTSTNSAKIAGNFGLVAAGAVLLALPGFASSVVGLLFIFPPTRAVVRTVLARKMRHSIENLGIRSFEMTNTYRQRTSYGSFGTGSNQSNPIVIDEQEIRDWTKDVKPEDFSK
ncbi:protein affecting phage T7 exclusion by the F plasmid [Corynebacterium mustelae]|uniref:Protein affecting phage T7 exclusion by the F plasmid n=1 Tax=Corynebacterium mustelae TaxID=571915 RepID=A0A0G3GZF5_9CORY|nr:FxsA family protein [Corynebacterium mustelae]AKK05910.1 protein affecting phage T7 exclusion by the F plasmid [Corynebacterium mustelae]